MQSLAITPTEGRIVSLYKIQQKTNNDNKDGGGPKDGKPGEKDNVVDADFEDVKDDKEKSA